MWSKVTFQLAALPRSNEEKEKRECGWIQCEGLGNLSDLSHCPTLKAPVSIVRA